MQIATLTRFAAITIVTLTAITVTLLVGMRTTLQEELAILRTEAEFRQLGNDLAAASDLLTREARYYSVGGDRTHYDAFWREVNETRTRDNVVARLRELGAPPEELALIEEAKANSDALIATESAAFAAVADGDFERARSLMFGPAYDRDKEIIMAPIRDFEERMNSRLLGEVAEAREEVNRALFLTTGTVLAYVIVTLSLLFLLFIRRVTVPLTRITDALDDVAAGEPDIAIPYTDGKDEIGSLAKAAAAFKSTLEQNRELARALIEHRDHLEDEVAARTTALTDANTELAEFAYRTSHDLRAPIVSSARLLSVVEESIRDEDPQEALTSLGYARTALDRLDKLLQDILALVKVERLEEDAEWIRLDDVLREALQRASHLEGFERLSVELDLGHDDPLLLKRSRLEVVTDNLISNAVKYQNPEQPSPHLRIETREDEAGVHVIVRDNGLGIPVEQQDKVFGMFKRFHPRTSFGSGLGLYLVKKSAEVLGGTMSFEDLGDGSLFRLTLGPPGEAT